MGRVLVVEDDIAMAGLLQQIVTASGHRVDVVASGRDALSTAGDIRPDVIVLDLGLPDLPGIDVIGRLRTWSDAYILVVSASRQVRRKTDALDAGADDFIDKPFDVGELRARLRLAERKRDAVLQRLTQRAFGELVVDYTHKRVHMGGDEVRLTDIEWSLLDGLSREPGRLMTHRWLTTHVWGDHARSEALVAMRTHMRSLRAKLRDDARRPRYIRTETGFGYRWVAPIEIESTSSTDVAASDELSDVVARLHQLKQDVATIASMTQDREAQHRLYLAAELVADAYAAALGVVGPTKVEKGS